jgi:hypothetical protein
MRQLYNGRTHGRTGRGQPPQFVGQKLYQQQSVLAKVTKTFFRMEKWEVNGQKKYIYGIKKQTFLYS